MSDEWGDDGIDGDEGLEEFEDVDADEGGLGVAAASPRGAGYAELTRLLQLSRKDLREAAKTLGLNEARYLVDAYYSWQGYRIAAGNQVRALSTGEPAEPADAIKWVQAQMVRVEDDIRIMLDVWTTVEPSGLAGWAKQHVGIGPVIAAGLRAYLDIANARTVAHWWRFAGLDPTNEWLGREKAELLVKGVYLTLKLGEREAPNAEVMAYVAQETHRPLATIERLAADKKTGRITRSALVAGLARRPWNAGLKVLLWKLGESFVKQMNHPKGFYGKVYAERKAYETDRNTRGLYADQAAAKLQRYNIGRDTDAYGYYAKGQLPPAHIHARCKRYAVKLFMSAYHEEAYRRTYNTLPPVPYAIAHLGHAHGMPCPVPFTPVPGEHDRTPLDKGELRAPGAP